MNNIDKVKKMVSDYRKNNKQLIKQYHQRRRMLKINGGKITLEVIQKVYEDNIKKYGTLTCYLCLHPIKFGQDNLEHKIPLCRGGNNEIENLDISCQHCNFVKHTKTEQEYREFLKGMPKARKVASSSSKKGTAYSYVSVIDGKVETCATWAACEKRVKGQKAKFKKVFSKFNHLLF